MNRLLAAIFLALSSALASAQFPATLARSFPQTFSSGHIDAEAGHHGEGATVPLCVVPPSSQPIEVTWAPTSGVCYIYENLTDHDLGVQNGVTGALHYIVVDGLHVDGISKWFGWSGHDCKAFDGSFDWSGDSGHWSHATETIPQPRTFVLDPRPYPRVIYYTLGGSVYSSTWPSGHGYPLRAKAIGSVVGSWRFLP